MGSGTIRLGGLCGIAAAVLPLLHTWVGLPGAYSMIAWVGLTGLLMLAIPPVVTVESVGA